MASSPWCHVVDLLTLVPRGRYDDLSSSYGFDEGVLVVTYSCLIARSGSQTRYEQLVNWLVGRDTPDDYEGVLAFDEAHKAKGAASDQPVGKAVVRLQEELMMARVVYLSATGATQVQDMAYMTRLGLWGRGTFFQSFKHIESLLGSGSSTGAGAMEMLAVQLKASGAYLARNLGLRGVDFHMPTVKLSDEQTQMYNDCAELWLQMWATLGSLSSSGLAPSAFEGTYTAAQTRFFQQLILSFKVPEIQRQARVALRAGKCVIIGLQSTGDAAVTAALAKGGGNGGTKVVKKLVSAAREVVEGMLHALESKQVQAAQSPLGGSSYQLSAYCRTVETKLDGLGLPAAALDELIDYFGAEHVAEMTGRQKRLIKRCVPPPRPLAHSFVTRPAHCHA